MRKHDINPSWHQRSGAASPWMIQASHPLLRATIFNTVWNVLVNSSWPGAYQLKWVLCIWPCICVLCVSASVWLLGSFLGTLSKYMRSPTGCEDLSRPFGSVTSSTSSYSQYRGRNWTQNCCMLSQRCNTEPAEGRNTQTWGETQFCLQRAKPALLFTVIGDFRSDIFSFDISAYLHS